MRVLHTIASIDPSTGGPARSVPNLAMALRRAGVEVALWTPEPQQKSWLVQLKVAGIETYSGDLADLPDFDVIHDHGVWLLNNRRVAAYSKSKRRPRIVSPRGMLEPWAMNHKKWKKKLAWWLYQRRDLQSAAALHATAESEAEQLRNLGFKQRIIVAANGVEVDGTSNIERPTSNVEGQVGYDSLGARAGFIKHQPTALFLSRIHPKKGLPVLVDAWSRVRPQGWRMRIVGPDEAGHRKEVEEMVAKAGLTETWIFEGSLDGEAKWDCYRNADLFILPTYSENFGIAVAEALACGVPVITTTGTPWEGLAERHCGWWVEPTASALETALKAAVNMRSEELRAMGGRGAAWMKSDFAWEGIADQMTGGYQSLLA